MGEFNYYCSQEQPYPDGHCQWCGKNDAKVMEGVDNFWLCEMCEKEFNKLQSSSG